MPIVNLQLQDKQAIGDNTKIVCMNGDYVVRIKCTDCASFTALPIKKLVLKAGTDYQESNIEEVTVDGETYLQAELPIVDYIKSIELGVYGKETEKGDPKYTSKPATFECEKSVLCGAVVLRRDPVLETLTITRNGKYRASEAEVDGYYEINVSVEDKPSEIRTVELSMATGSQVIDPSSSDRTMSQVVVTKPVALVPGNIRAGYSIGGVVGTYDKVLTETEIYTDGAYTPPAGVDGFSKVIVNVGSSNYAKLLRVGESFSYEYNTSVNITLDTPGVIKYENNGEAIIFTAVGNGNCSVILKDLDGASNVVNTVHYAVVVELDSDLLMPKEASNLDEMDLYLKEGVAGGIVKYTGITGDGFVRDALYIITEGEES